jgi:hypothetical protein
MDIWLLPGFSCRDLVAVLVKYMEGGLETHLFVHSADFSYNSEDPSPTREVEKLVGHCEREKLYLVVGYDSNSHNMAWGSTNCKGRGEALIDFVSSTNLEILNQDNEPTVCSGDSQEVTAITLGSRGLLESITGWGVSAESSLSDYRHILFILQAPGLSSRSGTLGHRL